MTSFRIFSAAVLISGLIAAPAFAQQAVQEPGMQAFYHSLGVGSGYGGPQSAFASVGNAELSVAAPRARHHVRASKRHASVVRQ